jgi:hypothetical protein
MNWFLRESSCSSWFQAYLKKQSQFFKGQNWRKVLFKKRLW